MSPAWEVRLPPHPSAVVSQMLAYWDKNPNAHWVLKNSDKIAKIRALVSPTAEEIESIMQTDHHTRLFCDGGHQRPDKVIIIDINCGEFDVTLCAECAREILKGLE